MGDLLTALALVLMLEGIALAILADRIEEVLERLMAVPPEVLRVSGVVAALTGLFLLWLQRG